MSQHGEVFLQPFLLDWTLWPSSWGMFELEEIHIKRDSHCLLTHFQRNPNIFCASSCILIPGHWFWSGLSFIIYSVQPIYFASINHPTISFSTFLNLNSKYLSDCIQIILYYPHSVFARFSEGQTSSRSAFCTYFPQAKHFNFGRIRFVRLNILQTKNAH